MIQTTKRAAIYTRVSTDDQSCERQILDLKKYAERCGYEVVATFTEKASGTKDNRAERAKVMKMAQSRDIDVILVSELSRWGRSTADLLATLEQLLSFNVSVVAPTGMSIDFATPQGKLVATLLSGFAEFERNLIVERTKSGLAAARARGKKLGRQAGCNPSDKYAAKVLKFVEEGRTYRWIEHELQISKTTVMQIVKRSKVVA